MTEAGYARDPIHLVKEIGLFAFSRGRHTCHWKTPWCTRNCYNNKFYRVNPKLADRDDLDNVYWHNTSDAEIARAIRALKVTRFRFAVRGEIWACVKEVRRVRNIMRRCPKVLFWIPTRAWRAPETRREIERKVMPLKNSRVMASIDPTTLLQVERGLRSDGWSILFSGDNDNPRQLLLAAGGNRPVLNRTKKYRKCVKTWEHEEGHCAVCKSGCFSARRVDIHLRQHQ